MAEAFSKIHLRRREVPPQVVEQYQVGFVFLERELWRRAVCLTGSKSDVPPSLSLRC